MQRATMGAGNGFGRGPRTGRRHTRLSLKPLGIWFAALGLSAVPWQALNETRPDPALLAQATLAQALMQRVAGAASGAQAPVDGAPTWARGGLPVLLPAGATAAPSEPPRADAPVHVAATTVKPAGAPVLAETAGSAAEAGTLALLLAPALLGPEPARLGEALPLSAEFRGPGAASAPVDDVAVAQAPAVEAPVVTASIDPEEIIPVPSDRPSMLEIPEPLPRPFSLQSTPAPERPRLAQPLPTRRTREALAPAAPPADDRGFLQKLFGVQKSTGPAMAYAVPQDDVLDAARGRRLSPTTASAGTAVYDIAAKVVYLPNGDKLEAHSGLGDRRDDPRSVHISMKGPTPPHLYDLTLREQLFHGVRALRLNPVGGSEAIHNRVGLLAHTFMLGPNGDSNGCVSFRDYDRFLQAYLRGDVKRLLVVASSN